jgi:hypothetical protein
MAQDISLLVVFSWRDDGSVVLTKSSSSTILSRRLVWHCRGPWKFLS